MLSRWFILYLLGLWLASQAIVWGFTEVVAPAIGLESALGLGDVETWLKVLVNTLFPLPFVVVLARRLVRDPA